MATQYGQDGEVIDNETGEIIDRVEPTGGLQPVITAEINQAVATAHMYPRRRDRDIINEITGRATLDESIASECNYSLKRGDKPITGPSIRFAEIVRASYGNIRVAARFVALDLADPERGAVIVEAVALDLEGNSSEIIPVRRSIMTTAKGGRKPQVYSADMINMTMNAASSIARRNAILAVVPKAIWSGPYQRVIKVLQGNADTLTERRTRLIEAFARVDVTAEMLFQALGVKDASDIRVDHMPAMIGMMTAIKDGEAVDSVLGRMSTTEAQTHTRVASPLKDDPSPETTKDDPPKTTEQPKTEAKSDPISTGKIEKTIEKPKEEKQPDPPKAAAKEEPKPQKTVDADVAPDGYGDEDQYLVYMRWHITHAKSATELKDKFMKTRADRRELLGADNLMAITTEYNARYGVLMGGDDDA